MCVCIADHFGESGATFSRACASSRSARMEASLTGKMRVIQTWFHVSVGCVRCFPGMYCTSCRLNSHHAAEGTSCVAGAVKTLGTSRRWSHITSIFFCNDSLRAPMNSAHHRKWLESRKHCARSRRALFRLKSPANTRPRSHKYNKYTLLPLGLRVATRRRSEPAAAAAAAEAAGAAAAAEAAQAAQAAEAAQAAPAAAQAAPAAAQAAPAAHKQHQQREQREQWASRFAADAAAGAAACALLFLLCCLCGSQHHRNWSMSKKKRSQNEAKAMPKQGLKAYQPTKALLDLKTRREKMKRSPAPWTAPGEACHRNSTSNGTLQQHPAVHQQPGSKAQTALWQQHLAAAPCSGTLQRHPAAAPCNGTSNPAQKRKHATLPILEVLTPIASLSGAKNLHEEKVNYGTICQPWKKRDGALVKRQSCMI